VLHFPKKDGVHDLPLPGVHDPVAPLYHSQAFTYHLRTGDAKAVLVGRPWIYSLGIAGKEGARDVLQEMLADLDQSMGLAGLGTVEDCEKGMMRTVIGIRRMRSIFPSAREPVSHPDTSNSESENGVWFLPAIHKSLLPT